MSLLVIAIADVLLLYLHSKIFAECHSYDRNITQIVPKSKTVTISHHELWVICWLASEIPEPIISEENTVKPNKINVFFCIDGHLNGLFRVRK